MRASNAASPPPQRGWRRLRRPDGTGIAYRVTGEGPTLVVLHGLAGSSSEFFATADALPEHRVVLVDQRGHGRSTRAPGDASRTAYASDVAAVVEEVADVPVTLIGHSMGAHTAMLAAAARPDLVERLVLLEVHAAGSDPTQDAETAAWFRSWPVPFADRAAAARFLGDGPLASAWLDDLRPVARGLAPRFEAEFMAATLAGMEQPRWQEWAAVRAPTWVIYGQHGMFSSEQKAEFLSRGQAGVRRIDLIGASHDAHLDAPDAWIRVLREVLALPHAGGEGRVAPSSAASRPDEPPTSAAPWESAPPSMPRA